jgi:hypothetical protein
MKLTRRVRAPRRESFSLAGCGVTLEKDCMTYQDVYQQGPYQHGSYQQGLSQNPAQWMQWGTHTPFGMNSGLGQAAFGPGQLSGAFGGAWGQRQLSPQDVGEVVRQIAPLLPQILAQSQQQPLAAYGYGGYGINQQRQLTPWDVNEVVRQLLPILPQIVGAIQHGQNPMHVAAMYGGLGQFGSGQYGQPGLGQSGFGQSGFGQSGLGGFGQNHFGPQSQFGQTGWPMQAAFGSHHLGSRQLSPQDVNDVVRQLVTVIPQVIGNLQTYGQRPN